MKHLEDKGVRQSLGKSGSIGKPCSTDWLGKGLKADNGIYVYGVSGLANFACHSGCGLHIVPVT